LIEAKEEAVERTLWSVASLLVHVRILCEQLQRELKRFDSTTLQQSQRRVKEARRQQMVIEDLIRATHAWDG